MEVLGEISFIVEVLGIWGSNIIVVDVLGSWGSTIVVDVLGMWESTIVVEILGSEIIESPFKLQLIVIGSSP